MTNDTAVASKTRAVKLTSKQVETWDEKAMSRSRRLDRVRLWGSRAVLLIAFLALWQFLSGRFVDPFWISSPIAVGQVLWGWIATGVLVTNLASTLLSMLLGFLVGAVSGVAVGFLLGRLRFLAELLDPFITAINSLPKIALAPLFILWFGIGLLSKVMLTGVIVFFMVFYNAFSGVRAVDEDLVDVAKIMGAGRRTILFKIIMPSSAVWIFAGLKLAIPYSLVGAVVAEIVASNDGIGYLLARSSGTFNTAGTFAALFVLTVVAALLNGAVNLLEKHNSRWQ